MFPTDAKTIRTANDTSSDNITKNILPSGVYTILDISLNSKDVRNSILYCGSDILFQQRSTLFTDMPVAYYCNNTVTAMLDRTSTITLTYVPYNLLLASTSTQPVIISSSGIALKSGFSYGEVLIILVLLMIFTLNFFAELKQWLFGVRIENPIKNKYNKDL